jgi:hypothetical protein
MRPIAFGLCLFAAACSGQGFESPTSPTSATLSRPPAQGSGVAAQTQAQGGTSLPFSGSFTIATSGTVNCPPTCPPTTLRVSGTEEGTATHLGSFTAVSVDIVDMATSTSTGTLALTAANGDTLYATTAGGQEEFIPPNISVIRVVATITGGTGRFEGATGTFTMRYRGEIDYQSATSIGSGTFEGYLDLNK